jgi:hypothetical protein
LIFELDAVACASGAAFVTRMITVVVCHKMGLISLFSVTKL